MSRIRSTSIHRGRIWRRAYAVAIAIVAISPILAAEAQESADEAITVTAPRHVGRSPVGATIEDVRVARSVSYHGLDLRTPAGSAELRRRIAATARSECDELEKEYPIGEPDAVACTREAVAKAQPAITRAIRSASAER
jgi:UrcA family protein